LKYYRNLLTIALPLLEYSKLTDDDFNAEFRASTPMARTFLLTKSST